MVRAVALCHSAARQQRQQRQQQGGLSVADGASRLVARSRGQSWELDGVYEGAHAAAELHDDHLDELIHGLLDGRNGQIVGLGKRAPPRAGAAEPVLDAAGLLPRATELALALLLQQRGAAARWLPKLRVGCYAIVEEADAITDLLNPDHDELVLRGNPGGAATVRGPALAANFKALSQLLQKTPNLAKHAHFVLVPGPDDPSVGAADGMPAQQHTRW